MKFLLELVLCCGSPSSSQQSASSTKEESRLLVGVGIVQPARLRSNRVIRRVNRGRYSGNSISGAVGEWQPSLSSISEENVAFYEEKGRRCIEGVIVSGSADGLPSAVNRINNLKRSNKVLSSTKTRRSSSSRDHSGWTTFQAMPAFSPAPFMF